MQDRDKIEEEKETTKTDKKCKQEIQDDKEGENNKGSRNNRARSKWKWRDSRIHREQTIKGGAQP